MYLSRLVLNPLSPGVRRDLANPYELHRTLSRHISNAPARFLWRLEPTRQPTLLVQSLSPPDWDRLEEEMPGYCLQTPEWKEFNPRLAQGMELRFRLRANPSVKRDGKRHGLNSPEEQMAWLKRKGEAHGFAVLAATATDERLIEARKGDHRIKIASVLYDGILRVADPGLLLDALMTGIGPAKGFGFGLLSLGR